MRDKDLLLAQVAIVVGGVAARSGALQAVLVKDLPAIPRDWVVRGANFNGATQPIMNGLVLKYIVIIADPFARALFWSE